jgi:hypothetical protein
MVWYGLSNFDRFATRDLRAQVGREMRKFGAIGLLGLAAATCSATARADDTGVNPLAIKPWHSTSELGYAAPETETRNITRFMDQAINEEPPMMPDPEITGPATSTAAKRTPPSGKSVASAVTEPKVTIVPPPRPAFTSTQSMAIPDPEPAKPETKKPARKVARLTDGDATQLRLPVPIVIGAFR